MVHIVVEMEPMSTDKMDIHELGADEKFIGEENFQIGLPSTHVVTGKIRFFSERTPSTEVASVKLPETVKTVCLIPMPEKSKLFEMVATLKDELQSVRIVKRCDGKKTSFMALLDFSSHEYAESFLKSTKSLDSKVLPVASVTFDAELISKSSNLFELPSCPVCLERLDSTVTGLVLTTACNHSIHSDCLSKLQRFDPEPSCPVCRYPQFSSSHNLADSQDSTDDSSECFTCGSKNDLWMCMICGHLGCGRYSLGHAKDHFQDSSHAYSFEINSQRVWDYAGEGYVHRLIRNKLDGKIVELPDPNNLSSFSRQRKPRLFGLGMKMEKNDAVLRRRRMSESEVRSSLKKRATEDEIEKLKDYYEDRIEKMFIEYSEILTSQLEAQKRHFEDMMKLHDPTESFVSQHNEELTFRAEKKRLLEKNTKKHNILTTKKHEKEKNVLLESVEKLKSDTNFLRQLNQQLLVDQKQAKESISALKRENKELKKISDNSKESAEKIRDLEEQVRDLMFFLDTQKQVKKHPELEQGVVEAVGNQRSLQPGDITDMSKKVKSRRKKKR